MATTIELELLLQASGSNESTQSIRLRPAATYRGQPPATRQPHYTSQFTDPLCTYLTDKGFPTTTGYATSVHCRYGCQTPASRDQLKSVHTCPSTRVPTHMSLQACPNLRESAHLSQHTRPNTCVPTHESTPRDPHALQPPTHLRCHTKLPKEALVRSPEVPPRLVARSQSGSDALTDPIYGVLELGAKLRPHSARPGTWQWSRVWGYFQCWGWFVIYILYTFLYLDAPDSDPLHFFQPSGELQNADHMVAAHLY